MIKCHIESVFKHYFPKLTIVNITNDGIVVEIDKDIIIHLSLSKSNLDIYTSELWFADEDFLYLHQSTDLNELMQVTKQKLNDMFADWMSKVN